MSNPTPPPDADEALERAVEAAVRESFMGEQPEEHFDLIAQAFLRHVRPLIAAAERKGARDEREACARELDIHSSISDRVLSTRMAALIRARTEGSN